MRQFDAGIISLLICGVPAILSRLGDTGAENKNLLIKTLSIILWFISSLVEKILLVPCALISAVLAFNPLSLLIVGIVHFISQYVADGVKLKQKVAQVVFETTKSEKLTISLLDIEEGKFTAYLKTTSMKSLIAEKLPSAPILDSNEGLEKSVNIDEKRIGLNMVLYQESGQITGACYLPVFKEGSDQNEEDKKQIDALRSILQLNIGHVTEKLEYLAKADYKDAKTILSLASP